MRVHEWLFEIDKLTNSIEEVATGKPFETIVRPATLRECQTASPKNGWKFQWVKEYRDPSKTVYKLVTVAKPRTLQGLIALEDRKSFIYMPLVESAPHNFGKNKQYLGVLGNLTAYACKLAFEAGYKGEVGFEAKTTLIQHYIDTLKATQLMGNKMGILSSAAKELVSLYYNNFTGYE